MATDSLLTLKLVISAILGGLTVYPLLKPDMSKDAESRVLWTFATVAITTFIFFNAVVIILAILAALFVFLRVGPVVAKTGMEAVGQFQQQLRLGVSTQSPQARAKQEVQALEGQLPEDVLREQEEWLAKQYGAEDES